MTSKPDKHGHPKSAGHGGFPAAWVLSWLILLVIAAVAIYSLLDWETAYRSTLLQVSFAPIDAGTLVVGIPFFIASLLLARFRRSLGVDFWVAALLFYLYTYVPYLLATPLSRLFFAYCGIVGATGAMALWIVMDAVSSGGSYESAGGDAEPISLDRGFRWRQWLGAVVLLGAFLFLLWWQGTTIVRALRTGRFEGTLDRALLIADLAIAAPLLLLGGVLVPSRQPYGLLVGRVVLLWYALLSFDRIVVQLFQAQLRGLTVDPVGAVASAMVGVFSVGMFVLLARRSSAISAPSS